MNRDQVCLLLVLAVYAVIGFTWLLISPQTFHVYGWIAPLALVVVLFVLILCLLTRRY